MTIVTIYYALGENGRNCLHIDSNVHFFFINTIFVRYGESGHFIYLFLKYTSVCPNAFIFQTTPKTDLLPDRTGSVGTLSPRAESREMPRCEIARKTRTEQHETSRIIGIYYIHCSRGERTEAKQTQPPNNNAMANERSLAWKAST